jgi:class 3 adenylate cyclase
VVAHPIVAIKQEGRRPLYVEIREPIEIGRECDGILLEDPQASRRHALLSPEAGNVLIEDLGSTNGIFLDGSKVSVPVVLVTGAVVRVGDTVLQLALPEAPVAPAAGHGARGTMVAGAHGGDAGAVKAAGAGPPGGRETSMESVARAVEAAPPALAAVEHDHGTVTIVFSDIESSTARASSMGDSAWMRVLGAHNDIVRRHVTAWHGSVIKNQGDGFMMTFGGARRALRAMIDVQRDLASFAADNPDQGVRVRVGVHTGEVIAEDGDIFGKHVMLAARVGGLAEGGQILVSSIVKEIASARGDLCFGDPVTVHLKGIDGEHTVYPVDWEGYSEEA